MDDHTGGILDRISIIGLDSYWKRKKIEYTSGLPIYVGCHWRFGIGTDDDQWEIWKFTWSGTDCTDIEGPLTGVYDDRVTLDWL